MSQRNSSGNVNHPKNNFYSERVDMSQFNGIEFEDVVPDNKPSKQIKEFICWDGEGVQSEGPQPYVLFGCSTGDKIIKPSLRTQDCFDLMFRVKREYPDAIHVGFAFGYDVNQILKDLSPYHFKELRMNGHVRWKKYRIEYVASKWIQVTWIPQKLTIKIQDIFSFFQCSFLKAINSYIPTDPLMKDLQVIVEGKADRNVFTYEDIGYIDRYWSLEIQLLKALADQLREYLFDVDFNISQWHGPGAIANYVYKKYGIEDHKAISPQRVRDAAAYAYAGGRFEMYSMGRHKGPIYAIDINSAYPAAIQHLPSLSEGYWRYVESPKEFVEFGVYHVRLNLPGNSKRPGPLFHRDRKGNISYPWKTDGWYWSPEVKQIDKEYFNYGFANVIEGWEYVGWKTRPFSEFVPHFYNERKRLKAEGNGSEKALKLALNSLYGKMAQRVGWQRNNEPPKWHQLEWAGWVTSYARAQLYSVMKQIPKGKLIAVETDGIYTTHDPKLMGIQDSKELGGWEVTQYAQIMYVQSGVYFYESTEGNWTGKYRGLDSGSLSVGAMEKYLQTVLPGIEWPPIIGNTTRFIGFQAALMKADDEGFKKVHRRWITTEREIHPGEKGKRIHVPQKCKQCNAWLSPYDVPHDLAIGSIAYQGGDEMKSHKHDIPWEYAEETYQWREHAKTLEGLLSIW